MAVKPHKASERWHVVRWAWEQEGLEPSEKFVLLALADRAGKKRTCWPSYQRIALDTGLSRSTVIRAVKKLREAGLIEVERQHTYKNKVANSYHMQTDKVLKSDE